MSDLKDLADGLAPEMTAELAIEFLDDILQFANSERLRQRAEALTMAIKALRREAELLEVLTAVDERVAPWRARKGDKAILKWLHDGAMAELRNKPPGA